MKKTTKSNASRHFDTEQFFSVDYTSVLYQPKEFKKRLSIAVKKIKPHLNKFDSIVVRGTSGTIFGGALSLRINKPLFVVRKAGESSHADSIISGIGKVGRYLFVDDFAATGTTRKTCIETLVEHKVPMKNHIGDLYYNDGWYNNDVVVKFVGDN